ncbi:putative ComE protein [Treponema primitia ZAS-2]|uniref:Putative ComE protein n=1 Tax=Treponema primitia (strain ATCC BAA-887 / DSM 12427 / ZAS-2) TaxID=545694 RepID=F5YIY8_TREPZ|nr:ComEC/Rec2 family competence protein [Treponema primitia]AEF86992.1 putative ComE protein [Treponema primitia ZAS-2]
MKRTPFILAGLGAALSFYTLGGLPGRYRVPGTLILVCIPIILVSLSRVLACGLPEGASPSGNFRSTQRHVLAWGLPGEVSSRNYRALHRQALALTGGLVLGIAARGSIDQAPRLGLPPETVRALTGTLAEDPRSTSTGKGMGYLVLNSAVGSGGLRSTAQGRVLVFFPGEALPRVKDFGRGAEIYVEGNFTESSGKGFAAAPLFRASGVHVSKPAPVWEQRRTAIRLALLDKLEAQPWGGLGAALILGVRDSLDSDLAQAYTHAGCSHVLALSGMHLAIVAALAAFFLRKPLGLKPAALAGAALIVLYVTLVGAQPSLERSAIMYLLGTAAILGFLPRQVLSLLAAAFLIQLLIHPSAGDSLSFTLSYLALAGILTVGETVHGLLRGRLPETLAQPLSASLGAYLATTAISASAFGMVRPVGLLAGLIIVPLTTVFMVAALAALGLSFFSPFLSNLVGMGLSALYALLDRLVSLAALVPGINAGGQGRELILSLALASLCLCRGSIHIKRRQALAPFN